MYCEIWFYKYSQFILPSHAEGVDKSKRKWASPAWRQDLLKEVILRPLYEGAKDYFYISDVDDRDYLAALIKASGGG